MGFLAVLVVFIWFLYVVLFWFLHLFCWKCAYFKGKCMYDKCSSTLYLNLH